LRADARRNQERLIASAREVFNERGVDAKMDEIARRAGVGPGTLYRHFATREDVLARIYRSDIEAIAGRAAELSASLPPLDALIAWLAEQLDFMAHKIGIGAAIKSMLRDDVETMDYCRNTMRGALRGLLEPLQNAGLIRADVDPAASPAAPARRRHRQ
jgi:AcrR family transcriptional regulator